MNRPSFSLPLFFLLFCYGNGQTETMIRNGDFEETLSTSDWRCNGGCTATLVEDCQSGNYSYKSSDRTADWQGPWQTLYTNMAGAYYSFEAYVKILESVPDQKAQQLKATIRYTSTADGYVKYESMIRLLLTPEDDWTKLAVTYYALNIGQDEVVFYISGPEAGVDFLVDSISLKKKDLNNSWRREARKRIKSSLRRGKLIVTVKSRQERNVTIEVKQLKHEFGFGSAVDSVTLQTNEKYRDWYLDNFEWAVLENDFKWRQTEWTEGVLTWNKSGEAMKILAANDKSVRGHAIFWANQERNPPWVQDITDPTRMYNAIMKRIEDLFSEYNSSLAHWDVNNEMLSNNFYMDVYNSDPTIRYDMFSKTKMADPSTQLFLNDFNVVNTELSTQMYVTQAQEFIAAGAPVEGMGVQSHLKENPHGAVILSRLDKLAEAGLPIWVTELDYAHPNDQVRARVLKDALLAYFSHPQVEGVLFWGFWDGKHSRGSDASLVDGVDMIENAAGRMWKKLFHEEFRTRYEQTMLLESRKRYRKSIKAFYGKYEITVKSVAGEVLQTKRVTLAKSNKNARVKILL